MVAGPLIYPVEAPLDDDVVVMHRNQAGTQAYTFGAGAQELADYIGNLQKAYAGINCIANAVAQALVAGVPAQVNAFNINDPVAVNAVPNAAANNIVIAVDGPSIARATVSFFGPPLAIYLFDIYQNGAPTGHRGQAAIDAAGAPNSCAIQAPVNAVAGDTFSLWVLAAAVATVTVIDVQLVVQKL